MGKMVSVKGFVNPRVRVTREMITAALEINRYSEISDNCKMSNEIALEIARGWMSPGMMGSHLARLASTHECPAEDLLDDIDATMRDIDRDAPGAYSGCEMARYVEELQLLRRWAEYVAD
jgi:hypothetical protein